MMALADNRAFSTARPTRIPYLRSSPQSYRNRSSDFSLQRRCESHRCARRSGGERKTYSKTTRLVRAVFRLVRTPRAAAEHKRAETAINVRNEKTHQGYSRPIQ
jgi:hypothetical protein